MKTIKIIAAIIAMFTMCGCMNLVLRPQAEYNQGPYFYTKVDGDMIKAGFNRRPIEQMLLPVTIIDWPFDAVADTVLLPWDWAVYSSRQRKNRKRTQTGLRCVNDGLTVEFEKED